MEPNENPYASPLALQAESKPRRFLYGLHFAAVGLLTISTIEFLFFGLTLLSLSTELIRAATNPLGGGILAGGSAIRFLVTMLCFTRTVIVIIGAINMRSNRRHRLALIGAIASLLGLAILPLLYAFFSLGSPWFIATLITMGVPFGAWALFALRLSTTREAFAEVK